MIWSLSGIIFFKLNITDAKLMIFVKTVLIKQLQPY